jgi:hypothetical protein
VLFVVQIADLRFDGFGGAAAAAYVRSLSSCPCSPARRRRLARRASCDYFKAPCRHKQRQNPDVPREIPSLAALHIP